MLDWLFKKKEPTRLEKEIGRLEETLVYTDPTSEDYQKIRQAIVELEEVNDNRHNKTIGGVLKTPQVIGSIIGGSASLLGIVIIRRDELKGIPFISAAKQFITKGR